MTSHRTYHIDFGGVTKWREGQSAGRQAKWREERYANYGGKTSGEMAGRNEAATSREHNTCNYEQRADNSVRRDH